MISVEELMKLSVAQGKILKKYTVKIHDIILLYNEKHDRKINYARQDYEREFDSNCRKAEERNMDLWVLLSDIYMIPEERHLIKPPNTLKNKKEKQDWIKKEFFPYFYEWKFNNIDKPIIYAFGQGWLSYKKRGKKRGKQETQGKITRQEIIIQKARELDVKKLLADGMKKKDINELVADSIPNENVKYVRQILAPLKYNP